MTQTKVGEAVLGHAILVALLMAFFAPVLTAEDRPSVASDSLTEYFQRTEQSLVDAVAVGDRAVWDAVLDDKCVLTTEEGEVLDKQSLLKQLTGLPPGLSGSIQVTDLTVQNLGGFAVVRFRLNEKETVFGQVLTTSYRSTDTFQKQNDRWKMIASHQSVITTDPPAQTVATDDFAALVGTYRLLPDGWTFEVRLRDGALYGGRDVARLKRMIPISSSVFVREGSLGEWIFSASPDGTAKAVELRKFETLVWTRTNGAPGKDSNIRTPQQK